MKFSDLVIGLFLVCLGVSVSAYGYTLPPMPGQHYGAGLFPLLLGLCFTGFGAKLAYTDWRERQVKNARSAPLVTLDDWARDQRLLLNMLLVVALIIAYVLFAERIGFVILSFAMLTVLFRRLGNALLRSIMIAALATLFIQAAFVTILRVPLPRGFLDSVLW